MKFLISAATLSVLLTPRASGFVPPFVSNARSSSGVKGSERGVSATGVISIGDSMEETMQRELDSYQAGKADTEFARRFGHLAGRRVKTVSEAFAEFTQYVGQPINALYRNSFTDLVADAHLTVVDVCFQRDPLWSLGVVSTLDLILKNYPERDIAADIESAFIKCLDLDENEVRAEAKLVSDWARGKSVDDISAALKGEGDSPLSLIAKSSREDEDWLYTRFFGVGLIKLMDIGGMKMEMDSDCSNVLEEWMSKSLGRPEEEYFEALSDSNLFFQTKRRLDVMETMMKEIAIREKKRMAERLEEKAALALERAQKDAKWAEEIREEEEMLAAGRSR